MANLMHKLFEYHPPKDKHLPMDESEQYNKNVFLKNIISDPTEKNTLKSYYFATQQTPHYSKPHHIILYLN
jgi:hypothetical protein